MKLLYTTRSSMLNFQSTFIGIGMIHMLISFSKKVFFEMRRLRSELALIKISTNFGVNAENIIALYRTFLLSDIKHCNTILNIG